MENQMMQALIWLGPSDLAQRAEPIPALATGEVLISVGAATVLHVAASTTNFKIQEHFNDFADAGVKEAVTGMVEVDPTAGCFPLPNGPGLGVTLNEAFVEEHPLQEAFFDLCAENWHQRQGATRGDSAQISDMEADNG